MFKLSDLEWTIVLCTIGLGAWLYALTQILVVTLDSHHKRLMKALWDWRTAIETEEQLQKRVLGRYEPDHPMAPVVK